MVLLRIRQLTKEEDGQALVLAALLMLVIALAVLGISSLGKSIHDRVQLQNAADNTAYTLAAAEARAFNFYAYSNRAQIAQYITILQILSVDSMLLGILVGLGTLAALMKNAEDICSGPKEYVCALVPKIGWLLGAISKVARVVERIAVIAAQTIKAFDAFVGLVAVPLLVGANLFLFAAQAAFFASVLGRLQGAEALRIARATSPGAELALGTTAHSAANSLRFVSSHFEDSMVLFGTEDAPHAKLADGREGRRNYARRGMGELIHASRYGADVYDRTFPGGLASSRDSVPGFTRINQLLGFFSSLRFRGHTRLHSDGDIHPTDSSMSRFYGQMEEPGYSTARYPTGNSVGANFYLEFGGFLSSVADAFGFNRKELASVTSTGGRVKGWVCSWDPSDPYRKTPLGILTLYAPRFSCDMNKGKHPWWGITPYMSFDATKGGCDTFQSEGCQPDVWVALRSPSGKTSAAGELDLLVSTPSGATRAASLGEGKGATAVARGLAYYHRPGSWKEPPNFFNPHWRAKLAPIESGLGRIADGMLGEMGAGAPTELLGQILTH